MQINLNVMGRELFLRLSEELSSPHSAFPKIFRQDLVSWHADYTPGNFCPENFLSFPGAPCALVIDVDNFSIIEKIQSIEKKVLSYIKSNPSVPLVLSPIVLVLRSPALLNVAQDFPDIISDWVFAPVDTSDLARRVLVALKRKNILKVKMKFGSFTLIPESQCLSYEDRTIHLTPSEFVLAKHFLAQMGAVISFADLVTFFKASGKSTEANNIRVAIFQLRLKLDMLTRSQISLVNVYKQGYCLRYKSPRAFSSVNKQSDTNVERRDALYG